MVKRYRRKLRRYSPRRAYRRFRRGRQPLPILPIVGLGIAMSRPIENALNGDYMGALAEVGSRFTGYNYQSRTFDPIYAAMNGWLPVIAGIMGSKICTMLGINAQIRKVPMVGKWVKM